MSIQNKKILGLISDRDTRRRQVKDAVDRIASSPVSKKVVQDLIDVAAGANTVKFDPSVNNRKGIKEGQKTGLAVIVAALVFGLIKQNVNMDPVVENSVAGAVSLGVTSLLAYVKMRIDNWLKIRALAEG